jgi:membrane fusion protein, multidrug efflux system
VFNATRVVVGSVISLLLAIPAVYAQGASINGNDFYCVLEPNTVIEISAPVEGVLDKVNVQRGDRIKRGQVLASLTSGLERASVELAKARVEFAKRKAIRNEELYLKKMISIHDKDETDTEVLLAQLQLKQTQEQLKLRQIVSPINGIVVERQKDAGEYVETEPLLTAVSLDPLNVEAVAPADLYGSIRVGMSAKVTTIGAQNETYDAKVTLIDQVIDAASGTIRVRLALPNPDNKILAGLRCNVAFKE